MLRSTNNQKEKTKVDSLMRFMMIVKASKDSEAGVIPGDELILSEKT